jgi:sigma-B regulation protein RsbU (phosphoserine phosphatase)
MSRSLTTRMIIRVWGSTMILFLAILAVTYYYSKKEVIRGIEEHSRNLAQYYAERFNGEFQSASAVARTMAVAMETHALNSEEQIGEFMKNVLAGIPEIYGTCIAFEPHVFQKDRRYFAPYYYRADGKPFFRQLGNSQYDYFNWDWYKAPISTGRPYWSEPYYDEGGGNTLMITYSHPFDWNGKRAGVATIDISLAELSREVSGIRVLKSGYGFIVSRSGRYITFPDETKIMLSGISYSQPELAEAFGKNESGFVEAKDPLRGENSWIVFYTVESARLTLAIVYPVTEALARVYDFGKTILWLGGIGMFCLMLVVALVTKSIVIPIVTLAAGAHQVSSGHFDFELPEPKTRDEVGRLTNAFNDMVRELKSRLWQLQTTTAEKERMLSELSIAREIQLSLLPGHFPARPGRTGFDLHGQSVPARQVGGDFYDFFWLDDDRIGITIGDVSDKGVPAALFMALCLTLLKATAMRGLSPDACLREVNRQLCPGNRRTMFVTVFYGIFRVTDGAFEYCNGGHLPPLLTSEEGLRSVDAPGGMALGIMEDAAYETHHLVLKKGSALFLFTDGITEAVNMEGKDFALGRLENLLRPLGAESPKTIVENVMRAVSEFAGEKEQFDDLTAMVLRYDPAPETAAGEGVEIYELTASLKEIPPLAEKVSAFLGRCGSPERVIFAVNLALEELIVNVISYGCNDGKDHLIRVEIHRGHPNEVKVVLIDDGHPFDPISHALELNIGREVQQRAIGGLGIHLARKMIDEIHYRREEGHNITTLIKKSHSVT